MYFRFFFVREDGGHILGRGWLPLQFLQEPCWLATAVAERAGILEDIKGCIGLQSGHGPLTGDGRLPHTDRVDVVQFRVALSLVLFDVLGLIDQQHIFGRQVELQQEPHATESFGYVVVSNGSGGFELVDDRRDQREDRAPVRAGEPLCGEAYGWVKATGTSLDRAVPCLHVVVRPLLDVAHVQPTRGSPCQLQCTGGHGDRAHVIGCLGLKVHFLLFDAWPCQHPRPPTWANLDLR